MSQPKQNITISPAITPQDYHTIAALETQAFYTQPFSALAFGPRRDSAENTAKRAKGLMKQCLGKREGEWGLVNMAVDEGGEIVGAAVWSFVTGRKEKEYWGEDGGDGEAKEEGEDGDGWPEGANVGFCEEVFGRGDECMVRSCGGRDYVKLNILIVSPTHQRRGIGAQLLAHGLKEADNRQLQCVLTASKEGLGLYKKNGFEVYQTMKIKLWEYEGGEGYGMDDHVVMNRAARS